MKKAKTYEKKIRNILARIPKAEAVQQADAREEDAFTVLVEGILQADATGRNTDKAIAALRKEFVDFNELRVAPVKEIVNCIGSGFPQALRKAQMLSVALKAIFYHHDGMSMDYLAEMKRRPLHRHLCELGLDEYAAGYVLLIAFGMPAVPVDETLVETLQMNGALPEKIAIDEAQKLLKRIVGRRNMLAAHKCFRAYVVKNAKALAGKRRAEAKAKARAEAEAKAQAEAEAKAQAEAKQRPRAKTPRARKAKKSKTGKRVSNGA